MKKLLTPLLLGLLLLPTLAFAQAPSLSPPLPEPIPATAYFPLHTGNQWEYQKSLNLPPGFSLPPPTPNRVINCEVTLEQPGFTVATLTGTFWGDLNVAKLLVDFGGAFSAGQVFANGLDTAQSGLLISPSLDDGFFASAFEPECPGTPEQMIILPAGTVTVPAGTFDNCIDISLSCPLLQDYSVTYTLAPNVGLIRHSISGLAGISREELVRAVIDGEVIEVFPETGLTTSLTTDRFLILGLDYVDPLPPNPDRVVLPVVPKQPFGILRAKFDIKNDTPGSLVLGYPNSCTIPQYTICDSAGNEIWNNYSTIRCAGERVTEIIDAGDTKSHQIRIRLPSVLGPEPQAGYYTLKATSRTTPLFSAEVPFLLEYVPPQDIPVPLPIPFPPLVVD